MKYWARRHCANVQAIVLLAAILWIVLNNAGNVHTHVGQHGEPITHAHPYQGDEPTQHSHARGDMLLVHHHLDLAKSSTLRPAPVPVHWVAREIVQRHERAHGPKLYAEVPARAPPCA